MTDDILDAAQKQIDEAARQLPVAPPTDALPPADSSPQLPATPSPTPPSEPTPMAPLSEKPPEIPSSPAPTPPATQPAPPTPTESALVDTIIQSETIKSTDIPPAPAKTDITSPSTVPPEPAIPPTIPPLPKKKGGGKGFVTAILFLLLLTVPIAVYYISKPKQLADIRNRATLNCGGYPPITCPNGSEACSLAQCTTATPTPAGVCAGLGGLGQVCRVPQNCNNLPNCDGTLVCLNGTCQQANAGQCGSSGKCKLYICDKCSNYGGGLDECRDGGQEVDCASAVVPAGQCGQVDILDAQGKYCEVKQQACTGSCAGGPQPTNPPPGGTPQPTPGPTSPPPGSTPTPVVLQCTRIRVYKNNTQVDPATLLPGDAVILAVAGSNATKGRIRVNGAAWAESTTLNSNGEYTVAFTIPTGTTSFTVEGEVFKDGVWQ